MAERTYAFRLKGDGSSLREESEAAAASIDRLAGATESLARDEAAAKATRDRFIESLQREASAVGKTRAELLQMQAAELGVTAQAAPLIQKLQAAERQMSGFGRSGKLSAIELQQVAFQLNDLGVQVASGQNPLIALVQQGSQLSGTFGGVGNTFRALASLITPAVVASSALAVALGAVAYGYAQGYRESRQLNDAIALTGNYAGQSAGQVDALAQRISNLDSRPIGDVREALQALIASGQAGPEAIEPLARAVVNLQKFTGEAAADIAKDLVKLAENPGQAAVELNRKYRFLTTAVFEQIRALQEQGRTQEAAAVAAEALTGKLAGQRQELGTLERLYRSTASAVSEYFDKLKNAGRSNNLEDSLEREQQALKGLKDQALALSRSNIQSPQLNAQITAQEQLIDRLRESQDVAAQTAKATAASTKQQQDDVERQGKAFNDRQLDLERARLGQQAAQGDLARARELQAVEQQYQQQLISSEQYVARRAAIEQKGVQARLAQLDAEIGIERRRKQELKGSPVEQEGERLQQQARLVELESRRASLLEQQGEIETRLRGEQLTQRRAFVEASLTVERAGFQLGQAYAASARAVELAAVEAQYAKLEITDEQYYGRRAALQRQAGEARLAEIQREVDAEARRPKESGAAAEAQREAKLLDLQRQRVEVLGQLNAQEAQRRAIALQAGRDLQLTNRQLGISLIRDERTRGQAQIAFEEQELKRRLDLAALNAEERKAVEDDVARYVALRQAQLTEELKPEYRRLLEGWRDTNRLMRETSDQFQLDFLRTGEDTFVRFLQTGKLSFKELGNLALESAARFTFRQSFGDIVGQAGSVAAKVLGFGGGSLADATANAGKAAATAAQTANTGAVTANTLATQVTTNAVTSLGTAAYQASIAMARISASGGGGEAGLFASLFSGFTGSGGGTVGDAGQTDLIGAFDAVAAKGMAFVNGQVAHAFAKGGAFNRGRLTSGPEVFAFRQGGATKTGMRGEAGTEAIFPLVRSSSGDLGVRAVGANGGAGERGGNVYVDVKNYGNDKVSVAERSEGPDRFISLIVGEVDRRIRNGGSTGQAISQVFGANPAAGLSRR